MTTPIFDPGTPEKFSDALATTQPDFLENFQELFDIFQLNHVSLTASGAGNHTIVQLLEQESDFQTGASELSIYCKDVDGQTDQVFLRYQGNGQIVQLTNYQIYSLIQPNTYFTILPGKLIVYFGTFVPSVSSPSQLKLFPPVAKNIVGMSFTSIGEGAKPGVTLQKSASGFFDVINIYPFDTQNLYYIIVGNL